MDFIKLGGSSRVLSDFAEKYGSKNRVLAGFGIGGKSGKEKLQGRYGYLFAHLRARFMPRKSFDTLVDNLYYVMVETYRMVDKHIKEQVVKQVPELVCNQVLVYVAEGLILERQKAKEETERLIAKAILQEHGNIQAQIKTHIDNAFPFVIPSLVDAPFDTNPQLKQQDIAIWLALQMKFERNTVLQTACRSPVVRPRDQDDSHDDALPDGENSAKRQKTSEYEAYVFGESSSGQNGNSGTEKIVLSLYKFPAIIFNIDDIEEKTSRWVNKKKPGKPKEEIYSNSKIIQVIKTYWELGHEHKFITEIVARRANDCIVSITEPDYKNLNKNDIEDIYLLIMNGKVPDYADTGLLWSLSVFIRSTVIWERVHDFQLGIESYQQKNSKKEKRVMRHLEIHKFCDATLNRVLEGLKSYNNDVKYGYVQKDLTKDKTEYLKLFEEDIEERLKHRRQMRR
ncbi:hypothetical protein Tco_1317508 [Tanacetum coccineum]